MTRPTQLVIKASALLHNVAQVKRFAPGKQIIAMVKANAYGCGIRQVTPLLEGHVDAFGVACLEEAMALHTLGIRTPCVIFQGIYHACELQTVAEHGFALVLHQAEQLKWLLATPLKQPISIWVKVNTGMHRLGFNVDELPEVVKALQHCSWVDKELGLMTHLACADEPERIENSKQIALFQSLRLPGFSRRSMANSAALIALPQTHEDVVRPGIMLYGVSPFANQTAFDLGLQPAVHFISAISAIHHNPPFAQVGYQASWSSLKPSIIGIVAAGYGDGYPRHIAANASVSILGKRVPIVGRVSMDTLAVDLTHHPELKLGDPVELWGSNILIEHVAKAAGTIAYELLCQTSARVHHHT